MSTRLIGSTPWDLRWLAVVLLSLLVALADLSWHALFPYHFPWLSPVLLLLLTFVVSVRLIQAIYTFFQDREFRLLRATRALADLNRVLTHVSDVSDPDGLAEQILNKTVDVLDASFGVLVTESDDGHGRFEAALRVPDLVGPPASMPPDSAYLRELKRHTDAHTLIDIPLIAGHGTAGVLIVGWRGSSRCRVDRDLLPILGRHVGALLENNGLMRALRHRQGEADLLRHLGLQITGLLDTHEVLQTVADHARNLFEVDLVVVCPTGREGIDFDPVLSGDQSLLQPEEINGGLNGYGAKPLPCLSAVTPHREPVSMCNISRCDPCPVVRTEAMGVHFGTLLQMGRKPLGVMCLLARERRIFGESQRSLLTGLTAIASVSLENARLYKEAGRLAVLEERERVAREMHDTVAQVLGYLSLKGRSTQSLLESGNAEVASEDLADLVKTADAAYSDVRETILGLRTSLRSGVGLVSALTDFLREFQRISGLTVRFDCEKARGVLAELSPTQEIQLLRVLQEALNNTRKHACAQRVEVSFAVEKGQLIAMVSDDGQGFDASEKPLPAGQWGSKFGLHTMYERMASVGGTLTIESQPRKGTRVLARLPVRTYVRG